MAIGAKIKSAVKKVVSSVKSAFSSAPAKSQGASALKAPLSPGIGFNDKGLVTVTRNGLTTLGGKDTKVAQNTQFSKTPSVNVQKALSSGGLTLDPVGRVVTPIKVNRASAPTNVADINTSVPDVNLSGLSSSPSAPSTTNTTAGLGSTGVIAPAVAAVKGLETKLAGDKSIAELQLADEQTKKNWLQDILSNKPEPIDIGAKRAELERQNGIQAKVDEINSLTQSLGQIEAQVQSQIAQTRDIMGSNNFINNQIKQIERNSEPQINKLRADINFKTGILTQNKELIAQAISDATATSRAKMEDFKWMLNEKMDIIKYISPELQRALNLRDKQLEWEHSDNVKEHEWKLEMATKYGANIEINDSVQTILEKIKAVGGRTISDRTGDNASGSSGFKNSKIEGEIRGDAVKLLDEVTLGNTTIEKVYEKLRRLYSPKEVTDQALKDLIGISSQQNNSMQPVTQNQGKPFFNNTGNYGTNPGDFSFIDKISNFLFR